MPKIYHRPKKTCYRKSNDKNFNHFIHGTKYFSIQNCIRIICKAAFSILEGVEKSIKLAIRLQILLFGEMFTFLYHLVMS